MLHVHAEDGDKGMGYSAVVLVLVLLLVDPCRDLLRRGRVDRSTDSG